MTIGFTIPGKPFGKQRPRTARRGAYSTTYTPKETVSYENLVKMCYRQENGNTRFEDDSELSIGIIACYEIPKSVSKKKRLQMIEGVINPTKKPDADNIAKIVCDSLNGIAYRDDSAITELHVKKVYSEEPCVFVNITGKEIEDGKSE